MYKSCPFRIIQELMDYSLSCLENNCNSIPVYAILLKNFKIIDESSNFGNKHAEIILLERNNIENLDILITLEPCPSCLFLLYQGGVRNIYFGAFNYQYGSCGGRVHLLNTIKTLRKINIFGGFCKTQNEEVLNKFFYGIRSKIEIQ